MSSIVPTSSYSITKFTVKFNCQPFMYLDSGKQEQELVVTDTGKHNIFANPEPLEARPIFKISMQYNAGMTISIGDKSIRIDDFGDPGVVPGFSVHCFLVHIINIAGGTAEPPLI